MMKEGTLISCFDDGLQRYYKKENEAPAFHLCFIVDY